MSFLHNVCFVTAFLYISSSKERSDKEKASRDDFRDKYVKKEEKRDESDRDRDREKRRERKDEKSSSMKEDRHYRVSCRVLLC